MERLHPTELVSNAADALCGYLLRELLPPWLPPLQRWLHLLYGVCWNCNDSSHRMRPKGALWWPDGCVVSNIDLQELRARPFRGNLVSCLLRNQAEAHGLQSDSATVEVYFFEMRDLCGASLKVLDEVTAELWSLNKAALPGEPKTEKTPKPEGQGAKSAKTRPDGPEAGCWLWWRGERHDIPQGVTYRLLALMWDRESAPYALIEDEVFGGATCPSSLRARVSEVNRVLKTLSIPWRLATNSTDRILTKQPEE